MSDHIVVKPLQWGETSYGTPEAYSVAGVYRLNRAWNGGWSVSAKSEMLRGSDGRTNFSTVDEAKAAAQQDFSARILSAIAAPPAEAASPIARLREMVERAQAIISTSTYPNWHASARAALESKGGSDAES